MNETTKREISSTQSCKRPHDSGDPATGGIEHFGIMKSWVCLFEWDIHGIPPELYGAIRCFSWGSDENEPNQSWGYLPSPRPQALFVTLIKHGCQLNSLIQWAISV